ncbi:MAG: hypothetical protein ABTR07_11405 [Candidatus Competibacter denitrificans]
MSTLPPREDPTLAAVDAALVDRGPEAPRPYLGASALGNPCDRALWYAFRWAREVRLSAKALKAIADGHHGETLMADRLRLVPGVTLWTGDDDGEQFGFEDLNGHLKGHVDGVIEGLLQAPKTTHVWEHKQVNEKKFARLKALTQTDEKAALEAWDGVYFVQAQLYMHYMDLSRHYLTCSTPGGREQTSCRTAYQKEVAQWAIDRARRLIASTRPPLRVSEDPEWFECRFCDYHPICHGREVARIHCRTCAYSTAQLAGDPWVCERRQLALSVIEQQHGCPDHLIHPDLFERHAEVIDGDPDAGTITYRLRETGKEFKNGHRPSPDAEVFSSHEIRVAASGCKDPYAAIDWLEAASDPHVAEMRVVFDAELTQVTPCPSA